MLNNSCARQAWLLEHQKPVWTRISAGENLLPELGRTNSTALPEFLSYTPCNPEPRPAIWRHSRQLREMTSAITWDNLKNRSLSQINRLQLFMYILFPNCSRPLRSADLRQIKQHVPSRLSSPPKKRNSRIIPTKSVQIPASRRWLEKDRWRHKITILLSEVIFKCKINVYLSTIATIKRTETRKMALLASSQRIIFMRHFSKSLLME